MSETIDFKFNQPVVLTLAFAEGRNVPSKYPGSVRTMRTTKDARVFFCDPQLEAKIAAMNPASGVQVEITKLEREGARKGFDWKVERIGAQPDGTYKIPKADSVSTPQCSEPASGVSGTLNHSSCNVLPNGQQSITEIPVRKPPSEAEEHCFRLIDITASAMKYAEQNTGGRVTRDDARSIALTVYIQAGRSGRLRWRPMARVGAAGSARRAG